jgi:exosortase/archaeosortase family protein
MEQPEKSDGGAGGTTRPELRFAITYVAIAATFFAVYCFPYAEHGISERWFYSYLSAYAHLAGTVLSVFEPEVHVTGTFIVGRTSLEIVKNCDAIEIIILFLSGVLAFPSPWRRKLAAVLGGVAILIFTNILRICTLYYVSIHAPSSFEFAHLELWPLVLVVLAGSEFVLWARWMRGAERLVPDAAV